MEQESTYQCDTCMHNSVCMYSKDEKKIIDELNEVVMKHVVAGTWPDLMCTPTCRCKSYKSKESQFNYK